MVRKYLPLRQVPLSVRFYSLGSRHFMKPNAALQARGAAEATQERRLFPVACKRVLGAEAAPTSALLTPNRAVLWHGEKGQVHTAVAGFCFP
jgi:hypothetical protein